MLYAQLSVDAKNNGQHFSAVCKKHCTGVIVCHFKIVFKKVTGNIFLQCAKDIAPG